jgi:hypothetical protein
MHDFQSLDYDFDIDGCNGVWAAPLWMTPDTWQWDAGSGEIDSLEFCARDGVYMNFAGGGHQVLSISLSINPSLYLSISLSIYLSIYLSIHLSI